MSLFLQALWFLLPAGFANIAPIFAAKLWPKWNTPVDFGIGYQRYIFFGPHKTYRGFVSGVIVGIAVFSIQQALYSVSPFFKDLSLFDYQGVTIMWGGWMGFCALLGDLGKSFFKRRWRVSAGHPWFPFDQLDWIVGALVGAFFMFTPQLLFVIAALFVGLVLHLVVRFVGYLIHINREAI